MAKKSDNLIFFMEKFFNLASIKKQLQQYWAISFPPYSLKCVILLAIFLSLNVDYKSFAKS